MQFFLRMEFNVATIRIIFYTGFQCELEHFDWFIPLTWTSIEWRISRITVIDECDQLTCNEDVCCPNSTFVGKASHSTLVIRCVITVCWNLNRGFVSQRIRKLTTKQQIVLLSQCGLSWLRTGSAYILAPFRLDSSSSSEELLQL